MTRLESFVVGVCMAAMLALHLFGAFMDRIEAPIKARIEAQRAERSAMACDTFDCWE